MSAVPGIDGFEVLRRMRAKHMSQRVLMLTARGELNDRVTGCNSARTIIWQPFASRNSGAGARARAQVCGGTGVDAAGGDLTLHLANQEVHRGDSQIELSTRELTLLKVLMREPGRVFTRTELCERVWEREHEYDMKLVEVFVGRLRKKIGNPPLIHTVRHVGYTIRESESP